MLHVKIDDQLKKDLQVEAKAIGLSLNAYIRMILIERPKNE